MAETKRLQDIKQLINNLSVEEFQELADYVAWPPKPEAPMHPAIPWDVGFVDDPEAVNCG